MKVILPIASLNDQSSKELAVQVQAIITNNSMDVVEKDMKEMFEFSKKYLENEIKDIQEKGVKTIKARFLGVDAKIKISIEGENVVLFIKEKTVIRALENFDRTVELIGLQVMSIIHSAKAIVGFVKALF